MLPEAGVSHIAEPQTGRIGSRMSGTRGPKTHVQARELDDDASLL